MPYKTTAIVSPSPFQIKAEHQLTIFNTQHHSYSFHASHLLNHILYIYFYRESVYYELIGTFSAANQLLNLRNPLQKTYCMPYGLQ